MKNTTKIGSNIKVLKKDGLKVIDIMIYQYSEGDTDKDIVKIFLGKSSLKDWWGDDWNDINDNDSVYNQFVEKEILFELNNKKGNYARSPFDFYEFENKISKDQMKHKLCPVAILCFKDKNEDSGWWKGLCYIKDKIVIFMGDNWEELEEQLKNHKIKLEENK